MYRRRCTLCVGCNLALQVGKDQHGKSISSKNSKAVFIGARSLTPERRSFSARQGRHRRVHRTAAVHAALWRM